MMSVQIEQFTITGCAKMGKLLSEQARKRKCKYLYKDKKIKCNLCSCIRGKGAGVVMKLINQPTPLRFARAEVIRGRSTALGKNRHADRRTRKRGQLAPAS